MFSCFKQNKSANTPTEIHAAPFYIFNSYDNCFILSYMVPTTYIRCTALQKSNYYLLTSHLNTQINLKKRMDTNKIYSDIKMISMLSNTAGKSVTTINWNINSHNIKISCALQRNDSQKTFLLVNFKE